MAKKHRELEWRGGSIFRGVDFLGRPGDPSEYRVRVVLADPKETDRDHILYLNADEAHRLAHRLLFQVEQIEKETGDK